MIVEWTADTEARRTGRLWLTGAIALAVAAAALAYWPIVPEVLRDVLLPAAWVCVVAWRQCHGYANGWRSGFTAGSKSVTRSGICGDRAPQMLGPHHTAIWCDLPHGHAGWHQAETGVGMRTNWTRTEAP